MKGFIEVTHEGGGIMKEIIISIKPMWCEAILNGYKTVEVRKTEPNCFKPFKCYIYQTNNGGIVGEFVCGWTSFHCFNSVVDDYMPLISHTAFLTTSEILNYGKGKPLYCWHIIEFKRYDKPKPLSEFGLKRPPQSWQYVKGAEKNEN